ncbi:hypothetical protein GC101_25255 [Paenibacillus sp. LMG 31459]|uniref:Calcineurin-like phosphoesterase domain-containing protein n=1 Tax=Paenibacillus phytohabitans TaxID=2654978 RepID=A0ABX1YMI6_9BACL|nr:metallophosphoesterase [Paenibacillus phytohabitans]NOU82177.1 hypothetical protein [Paenibacillus phytohabitans]
MMNRIVHLSDFHLSKNDLTDFRLYCLNPLIADLKRFNSELKIDLIIFSGDLVDKGGLSFDKDIEIAFLTFEELVISPILSALMLPKDRFIFVPGNHDINRIIEKPRMEIGLLNSLNSPEEVNNYIDEDSLDGSQRIVQFKDFEKAYFHASSHKISNFASSFIYKFGNLSVGVSCFNSAWRCWDSDRDKGNIIIGERQVTNARQEIENCDVKIAVVHHPIDWLASFERKHIDQMIQRSYNMMFCGHVHEGESSYKTSMYGGLFISTAPSNWSGNVRRRDRDFANGYSIVDFTQENITMFNRRYNHSKESFDPNPDMGDHEGKIYYKFPNAISMGFQYKKKDLCDLIKTEKIQFIDEHLLSYRSQTQAPKKIDELFVLPHLTQTLNKEETVYNLEGICSGKDDIIFVGRKESGKTILLDKLLVDFTEFSDIYNEIPVPINLDEWPTSNFQTDIGRFLNLRAGEVNELLKNQKIVLLIDNITPNSQKNLKLKNLEKFITENRENVRVIATAESLMTSDLPLELKKHPLISKFTVIDIKPFRSKQIRSLIQNWFSTNEKYNNSDSLEEVIKIFNKLNIPRTPLAVSMFLSIIETQPNYTPINNATMLENYIEELFNKHSIYEILSGEFDYKNKQRLLTEIAYEMYKLDSINYRIGRTDLILFIENYLISRKFSFKAEDILHGFEMVGVFAEEFDNKKHYIHFRFNCFYKYFLMKNMDLNTEFKQLVLSETNYVFFEDEIDYYTGIKRDEEEVLSNILQRMNIKFDNLLKISNNMLSEYDEIFYSKNSLISQFEDNFIETIGSIEKPSEDEIDEINDSKLEVGATAEIGIPRKDNKISSIRDLEISWSLLGKVLKNTEETTNGDLKLTAYQNLIRCSAILLALSKILVESAMEQNEIDISEFVINLFPFGMQILTHNLVASSKLAVVMEEDIKAKFNPPTGVISELELFLSVFIFADLKKTDHTRYIKELINKTKKKYIKDNILVKLMNYYYFKQTNDLEYLNLLGDLTAKERGNSFHDKSKAMDEYKLNKQRFLQHGDVDTEIT